MASASQAKSGTASAPPESDKEEDEEEKEKEADPVTNQNSTTLPRLSQGVHQFQVSNFFCNFLLGGGSTSRATGIEVVGVICLGHSANDSIAFLHMFLEKDL